MCSVITSVKATADAYQRSLITGMISLSVTGWKD